MKDANIDDASIEVSTGIVGERERARYWNRIFEISLTSTAFTKDGTLTQEGRRQLAHEHVHLFQQLATGYGAREVWSLIHEIDFVEDAIRNGTNLQSEQLIIEREYLDRTRLDKTADSAFVAVEDMLLSLSGSGDSGEVQVVLVHSDGQPRRRTLGSSSILEAQAMAVEAVAGLLVPSPGKIEYRYRVIRDYLDTKFVNVDDYHVIAICYFALFFGYPAVVFHQIVDLLFQTFKNDLPDANVVHIHLSEVLSINDRVKNVLDGYQYLHEHYERRSKDEPRAIAMRWAREKFINVSRRIADKREHFPLELFGWGQSRKIDWSELESLIPIPRIRSAGNSYVVDAEGNEVVIWMTCFSHLVRALPEIGRTSTVETKCPIFGACELVKDDACERRPWAKVAEAPYCYYAVAARMIGLNDETLTRFTV